MMNGDLNHAEDYDTSGGCGCQAVSSCGCQAVSSCGYHSNGVHHGHSKEKHCRAYNFVSKNPFDVGIAKQLDDVGDEYLILLSGNHHSVSDYDHDNLPDWVAMGERPCRIYKTIATDELVSIWDHNGSCWDDPCYTKKSFKKCPPNGFLNFYLTNGTNRSQVVEIRDAKVDRSQADPTLVLKVKVLHKGDDRLDLDGLFPRMFRVSLVIDHYGKLGHLKKGGHHKTRESGAVTVVNPPAPVINTTIAPTTTVAPTVANTTVANQQQALQLAQQQQMDKKEKRKHHKKCKKIKNKKKKEKCLKKHGLFGEDGEDGEEPEEGGEGDGNERLLQRIRLQEVGLQRDITLGKEKKKSRA